MAEFYLHNKALTYKNVWDPNTKVGHLKLVLWHHEWTMRSQGLQR